MITPDERVAGRSLPTHRGHPRRWGRLTGESSRPRIGTQLPGKRRLGGPCGRPFFVWFGEMRSIVYVDGFNLSYGALEGGPHRWLDLDRCFALLRTDDDVQRIWYVTAVIQGARRQHQRTYLQALRSTPRDVTQDGRYKEKVVRCTVAGCGHAGTREFHMPEEKGTDVNSAVQMLDDAYPGHVERMVLVSGDSDLVPAVRTIKRRFPTIRVIVYVPARDPRRGAATELRMAADKHKTPPPALLARAQLPVVVSTPKGSVVRPASWAPKPGLERER